MTEPALHWRAFQVLQRVVKFDDYFVSYVDEGTGEPVILLHGIPTWGYLWHGLVPTLSRTHRVLVPDLVGFGYSDKGDRFEGIRLHPRRDSVERPARALCDGSRQALANP
jgi:pimeloyl-ACP methyl ester carboxylesterase